MKKSLLFLPLLLVSFLFAQDSLNVSLRGHLSYQQDLSDVWGYVDSTGNEWAIVGVYNGTSIVDLADPSNPVERFFIPGANSIWRDMKTWDHYAYVTNETANGLLIIDLSDLPNNITYKDTTISGMNTAHNIYIDSLGYAYVVGADIDNGGISIFDLNADPWNPTQVGAYTAEYVHDVYVRNNLAYAAEIYAGKLTVIDVSNKSSLQVLGSAVTPRQFAHNTWLSDNGQTCFVTEELDAAPITSWDVSNPSNMTELDRIYSSLSNGNAVPHNSHVLNDFVITSYYADGLHIVDGNRPSNLVEVGYYDSNTNTGGGTFGMWGAYPWLPSGIVLGTDMGTGFFVFDVNYERASYLEGTATDGTNPLSGVLIEIQNTNATETTITSGDYKTGIPGGGTFTCSASKFGYVQVDTVITFTPGQLVNWDPVLTQSPSVSFTVNVVDAVTNDPVPFADVVAIAGQNEFSFTADANGQVVNASIVSSNYDFVAGKWGYVSNGVNQTATPQNNSVTIALDKGYADDFTFDNNWVVDPGTSTQGIWEWGPPVASIFFGFELNPGSDYDMDYGNNCLVTGNNGVNPGDDDVNGWTTVTSPVMDLSGYNNPFMTFRHWFLSASGSGNPGFRDSMTVWISNGNTTVQAWEIHDDLLLAWIPSDTIWISNYVPLTDSMTVTFRVADNFTQHWVEGGVDDWKIGDSQTVGVSEEVVREIPSLKIWPSPAYDQFWYEIQGETPRNGKLAVYDVSGNKVFEAPARSGAHALPLSYAPGLYFVALESDGQRINIQKLVVARR